MNNYTIPSIITFFALASIAWGILIYVFGKRLIATHRETFAHIYSWATGQFFILVALVCTIGADRDIHPLVTIAVSILLLAPLGWFYNVVSDKETQAKYGDRIE